MSKPSIIDTYHATRLIVQLLDEVSSGDLTVERMDREIHTAEKEPQFGIRQWEPSGEVTITIRARRLKRSEDYCNPVLTKLSANSNPPPKG